MLKRLAKNSSENYICFCRLLQFFFLHYLTKFRIETNSVDPDQTAPIGAV